MNRTDTVNRALILLEWWLDQARLDQQHALVDEEGRITTVQWF